LNLTTLGTHVVMKYANGARTAQAKSKVKPFRKREWCSIRDERQIEAARIPQKQNVPMTYTFPEAKVGLVEMLRTIHIPHVQVEMVEIHFSNGPLAILHLMPPCVVLWNRSPLWFRKKKMKIEITTAALCLTVAAVLVVHDGADVVIDEIWPLLMRRTPPTLIHFVDLWRLRLRAGDWGAALRVTNL
jgi:hypothetical protein